MMNISRSGPPNSIRRRLGVASISSRPSRRTQNNYDDYGQPFRSVHRPQILQPTSANLTNQSMTQEAIETILAETREIRESTNSIRRSANLDLPSVLRSPTEIRMRNEAMARFQPEEARAQIQEPNSGGERGPGFPLTLNDNFNSGSRYHTLSQPGEPRRARMSLESELLGIRPFDPALLGRRAVDLRAETAAFLASPSSTLTQGPRLDGPKEQPSPLEQEDMNLDCGCKVCFGQIANTLLLPCSHLVLCEWCADQIGAKPKEVYTTNRPSCPVCRKIVMDRVKVFRG